MTIDIGRREFVTVLGGASLAWPLAARAQQSEHMRLGGFLESTSAGGPGAKARHEAFLKGLEKLGWTPGRNVRIEVRWSGGDEAQTRKDAAELVALAPDVIVVGGGSGAGRRVTRDDVLAAVGSGEAPRAQAAPAAAGVPSAPARIDGAREELVKLSVMRRSIAEHMARSLATSPHAWTVQEVDVTNLAANRIADMDRRKVKWKYFYDANVVGRNYRPFDASKWPLFESGLLGPVTLTPLKQPAF